MWRELKDNNLKKTKAEFVLKEFESQHIILFIISKSSILISCSTISNLPL